MENPTYTYDVLSSFEPMVIASNTISRQQDFELMQASTLDMYVVYGGYNETLDLADEVVLIVSFLALMILMYRKRKHAHGSN
jgi:hypothetical protein